MAQIRTKYLSVYSSGNQSQDQTGTVCPLCPIHKLFEDRALKKKIKAASEMPQWVNACACTPEPRLNLWKLQFCLLTLVHAHTRIKLKYTKPSMLICLIPAI